MSESFGAHLIASIERVPLIKLIVPDDAGKLRLIFVDMHGKPLDDPRVYVWMSLSHKFRLVIMRHAVVVDVLERLLEAFVLRIYLLECGLGNIFIDVHVVVAVLGLHVLPVLHLLAPAIASSRLITERHGRQRIVECC